MKMSRGSIFVTICLFLYVYSCSSLETTLPNGAVIEIEALEPNGQGNLDVNTLAKLLAQDGAGGTQTRRVVNEQPVTIEVITDNQFRRPNQHAQGYFNHYNTMGQNIYNWHQTIQPQHHINPINPHQRPNINQGSSPNFYITKDTSYSNNPNIAVYDVVTYGTSNNNQYPNQYGSRYPNFSPGKPNINQYLGMFVQPPRNKYPNSQNIFPFQNPNKQYIFPYPNNMGHNVLQRPNEQHYNFPDKHPDNNQFNDHIYLVPDQDDKHVNKDIEIDSHDSNNMGHNVFQPPNEQHYNFPDKHPDNNQFNGHIYPVPDQDDKHVNKDIEIDSHDSDKQTSTPVIDEDLDDSNKSNVAGYINKFPVILLNENEIRR